MHTNYHRPTPDLQAIREGAYRAGYHAAEALSSPEPDLLEVDLPALERDPPGMPPEYREWQAGYAAGYEAGYEAGRLHSATQALLRDILDETDDGADGSDEAKIL